MNNMKKNLGIAIVSYMAALVVYWVSSPYIAIAIPAAGLLIALSIKQRGRQQIHPDVIEPQQQRADVSMQSSTGQPSVSSSAAQGEAPTASPSTIQDPELASALEYIGIIEDMILLEGEKNNLDDEIVQKVLALLARLNRLIPDLVALGDASINHNIVRLVRKDLNSTINPFIRLSGEAKSKNRRLLLDGIKDINSKLTFYTKTIEQKDLMELHTKAELIQQRYRLTD
ncbi:hypothetical protein [Paenibacillus gorillae]|uniref:hypothetical protein n=1 Tax=Paenibacillus gorillae TaxID=1243662 RepID=UPI0004B87468|nr:hypothetical protein [Paenibacillus gorillae]